jgi:predicted RNA-binding protein with PUA-like domain
MKHWLLKSEPTSYSIDDLKKDLKTRWTGVRNYQARNFLRAMEPGDGVLFYHSSREPLGIVGVAVVTKKAEPEKENSPWFAPEISFVEKFKRPLTLAEIKIRPELKGISVAQKGSRLSVMPISEEHFHIISKLGASA